MKRIKCIDYLKTFAIIGVVFYHMGLLCNGYLGVEIFFVISGYLFVKGNKKAFEDGSFKPFRFCLKKLSAFWPLIVVGGVVSLAVGYTGMLPDDYENLSESVVASVFFLNNVLQVLISKDYWDIVNTYKPLMHTWYICVLMQTFVFLAFTLWISRKIAKKDCSKAVLRGITAISLVLYLLPFFSGTEKFYQFYFRVFEITSGGLIAYFKEPKFNKDTSRLFGNIGIFVVTFIILSSVQLPSTLMLLCVIIATIFIIWTHGSYNEEYGINEKVNDILSVPGKYSYDIYVWHQIIIAFLYYWIFQNASILLVISVIAITAILSFASIMVRKKAVVLKSVLFRNIFSGVFAVICTCLALVVYFHAGVVRDIPELEIDRNNVHRNMHAEYVDQPYSWNNDFVSDKIHVLVMGNSFGRDFANILNESRYADQIEISYLEGSKASNEMDRVNSADYIFFSTNSFNIPESLSSLPAEKLYIVGNKKFGNSNGIIYFNRRKENNFLQTVPLPDNFMLNNHAMKGVYGDHYRYDRTSNCG